MGLYTTVDTGLLSWPMRQRSLLPTPLVFRPNNSDQTFCWIQGLFRLSLPHVLPPRDWLATDRSLHISHLTTDFISPPFSITLDKTTQKKTGSLRHLLKSILFTGFNQNSNMRYHAQMLSILEYTQTAEWIWPCQASQQNLSYLSRSGFFECSCRQRWCWL